MTANITSEHLQKKSRACDHNTKSIVSILYWTNDYEWCSVPFIFRCCFELKYNYAFKKEKNRGMYREICVRCLSAIYQFMKSGVLKITTLVASSV